MRQILRRNSRSLVAYSKGHEPGTRFPIDIHRTTLRRVANRIGQEIHDHLANPHRIDVDERQVSFDPRLHGDVSCLGLWLKARERLVQQRVQIGWLLFEGERSALGMRQRPKILNQPGQRPRIFEDPLDMSLVAWIHAVQHTFEPPLHHGERCPQLVSDVGHQLASLPLLLFQSRCHAIERGGDRPQRWRSELSDSHTEIP